MNERLNNLDLSPEMRHKMRSVINDVYLLSETIPNRQAAIEFNSLISGPLTTIRRKFELASGRTVKVKPK